MVKSLRAIDGQRLASGKKGFLDSLIYHTQRRSSLLATVKKSAFLPIFARGSGIFFLAD
jgi:hypothetical protein